ncbi:MAG: Radical SAM superfamily protein [Smithella sp. PtaU1.Bin162]|nr:MAG: Radical SAM superfamily protein [Smithella sp. PtaU1.Bin162]
MINYDLDGLLLAAEKPSRYIGAEVNSVCKNNAEVNFLLAFPDTYEVGMSHLGMQILYAVLNKIPYVAAERSFAPWPDREKQLRDHHLPLTSLESQTPLKNFDIVGFSLQYELSYTNVLNMLDLGGIPLKRHDRRDDAPLILAGGPCCFNPAPLIDFIDAFVIGEGEEVVAEITDVIRNGKKNKLPRQGMLAELAQIPGIYVPAVHNKNHPVKKRKVIDLNLWPYPARPVVPLMQTIHDRIVLEIARGCTRGCRFCQAGMLWRPYRERNYSLVKEMAEELLNATGHDEISLLALSSGDYSCIEPLISDLMNRHYARRVALALPSLRVESLTGALIEEIKRTRKTSFTLAPEAGTDKMRRIINKGNSAGELLSTVDKVFSAGWKSIKLYFMIGLPEETEADLEGIVDLAYQALRTAKNRGQITISLSTYVPKPHTPFQWHRQISLAETYAKQEFIRGRIRSRNLTVKWHDARMSMLEGLFSRGDEKTGLLLERAFQSGCRFDGWSDLLRFDLWQEAIVRTGINPEDYTRERKTGENLPWDNIDCGVSRKFLLAEREKAALSAVTADCRFADCQNCGVCDFSTTKNVFSATENKSAAADISVSPPAGRKTVEKQYRFTFSKLNRARFLSHLELSSALIRALRRSSLFLSYSAGYHPHPRISFATATSVGMESAEEFVDVTCRELPADSTILKQEINSALPDGIKILAMSELAAGDKDLAQSLTGFSYDLYLPRDTDPARLAIWEDNIKKFIAAEIFNIERKAKGKNIVRDIRPYVEKIILHPGDLKVQLTIRYSPQGSARPTDIIEHVLTGNEEEKQQIRVVKTQTLLRG